MVRMNTLKTIETIAEFDGESFIEWTGSLNDILQIAWSFLSEMIYGLVRPESILSWSREGERNPSDFDDNNSKPSDVSGHDWGSLNEEP